MKSTSWQASPWWAGFLVSILDLVPEEYRPWVPGPHSYGEVLEAWRDHVVDHKNVPMPVDTPSQEIWNEAGASQPVLMIMGSFLDCYPPYMGVQFENSVGRAEEWANRILLPGTKLRKRWQVFGELEVLDIAFKLKNDDLVVAAMAAHLAGSTDFARKLLRDSFEGREMVSAGGPYR